MEEEDMTFIKITADNKELYLFTTVKEEGYDLIITDCQDFWSGSVLKKAASHKQCSDFQPLTRTSDNKRSFDYEIKDVSGSEILFKWKEKKAAEDFKFTLGTATLYKMEGIRCITQKIFDHCINMISHINEEITSVKEDKETLLQERTDTLKRLDKLVGTKETLEQELYSKFLAVLNTKKTEISTLREKIKNLESKVVKSLESEEDGSDMETSPSSSVYEQETQIETVAKPMFSDESSEDEISEVSRQTMTYHEAKKRAKVSTMVPPPSSSSSAEITAKTESLPRKRSLKKDSPQMDETLPILETANSDELLDDM